jgi:hypothetical protein
LSRVFPAVIVLLALVLLPMIPVQANGSGTVVSIPDATVGPGGQITLPINIIDITDVGAVTIWLHYNSSVVWVTNVTNGELGNVTYSMDNATGLTIMDWFSDTGETGDFVFAYVTLKAVGSRDETSPLNLDVITLKNTYGNSIAYTVDNGTFTIGLMEGDVNLDGCVSIVDAMFIAQWVVGLRTLIADQLECADTFDIGNPDIADAMHIAQWVVDPDGSLGVLIVPLWQSPADDNMLHPQPCPIRLMEGDVTLDGCVNIVDVMFIVQWVAGGRTLSADQLECACTLDRYYPNGTPMVDIADANFLTQWLACPDCPCPLFVVCRLWDPIKDAHMLYPQLC